jgi:hypothetical protein
MGHGRPEPRGRVVLGLTLRIDSHHFMANHGIACQSADGAISLLP